MCLKRPRTATLDEVRITREGEGAIITFRDPTIATTRLQLGSHVAHMSLGEILDRYNACIRTQERMRAEYDHVPIEVPQGSPQIEYFAAGEPVVHVEPGGE